MILSLLCSIVFAASIYLLLDVSLLRKIFGLVLFGSGVNLVIFISGRLANTDPVILNDIAKAYGNPLAQALILTSLVIGFGLLAFLVVVFKVSASKHMLNKDL